MLPSSAIRPAKRRWTVLVLGLMPAIGLSLLLAPIAGFAGFNDERYLPVAGMLWGAVVLLLPAQLHLASCVMVRGWPESATRRTAALWCAAGLGGIASGVGSMLAWPQTKDTERWGAIVLLALAGMSGSVLLANGWTRLGSERKE